jgi:ribosome-associated toxin RatA of RatAB toxin-antitoxin module
MCCSPASRPASTRSGHWLIDAVTTWRHSGRWLTARAASRVALGFAALLVYGGLHCAHANAVTGSRGVGGPGSAGIKNGANKANGANGINGANASGGVGEVVSVQAQREGTAVRITTQAIVRAPHDLIWKALSDYDRLAEFIPGITKSRVMERRDNNTLIVEQAGKAHLWLFTYAIDVTVEVTERPPDALSIRVIQGNLKQLEGGYVIQKLPGGDNVYQLQWSGVIEPALPVPTAVSLPLMRNNIAEQFEGMVREIERRELKRSRVGARANPRVSQQ